MKKISLVLVLVALAAAPAWAAGKNNSGSALKKTGAAPMGLKLPSGSINGVGGGPRWIYVANTVISDHRPGTDPISHGFVHLAAKVPPPARSPIAALSGNGSSSNQNTTRAHGGVTITERYRPQTVTGGW